MVFDEADRAGSNSSPDPVGRTERSSSVEPQRIGIDRQIRHDLRSHLNKILGYSDLLTDDAVEQGLDAFVPDLQKIHAAGRELLTLVNRYVDPISAHVENAFGPLRSHDAGKSGPRVDAVKEDLALSVSGRFLIADDDAANRDLLQRLLRREGNDVVAVENGRQLLERVVMQPFDLILLDLIMPEMDGIETLHLLKENEATRHLPVIMISALDDLSSVVRCIEMGAEDYLPKPFDPILLRARIGACLEKKRLRDREVELFVQVNDNYRQLQELQKLREDLTHMIVHDLRTPLTSLLAGLQTLQIAERQDEMEQEILDISVYSGYSLLGMINDLLDISKMEDGSLTLEKSEVSLAALIDDALRQVGSLARDKQLTLISEVSPQTPRILADEDKVRRVLINLLGNAVKFTPPGGTISITVRCVMETQEEAPVAMISVRDTGEGIPKEAFGRIFEKFGQVETRNSSRKMSTGLGLTFCKMAVEAHGGQVWVESELGVGSTFFFTLPGVRHDTV